MKIKSKFDKTLKNIVNNLQNFEFGAVQRFLNLVDLEKCCNSRAQKGPPLTGPFLGQSRYFGFIMVELFILGSRSYVRDF